MAHKARDVLFLAPFCQKKVVASENLKDLEGNFLKKKLKKFLQPQEYCTE
jgi:hypothetical protein